MSDVKLPPTDTQHASQSIAVVLRNFTRDYDGRNGPKFIYGPLFRKQAEEHLAEWLADHMHDFIVQDLNDHTCYVLAEVEVVWTGETRFYVNQSWQQLLVNCQVKVMDPDIADPRP